MRAILLAWLAVLFAASAVAATDEEKRAAEEEERKAAFVSGMETIVADMNEGSFEQLAAAIDEDDMLERIFALRLIDQRLKRDFRERMEEPQQFENFIASQYAMEATDGVKARLLLVESRGERGRAVVRFDMSHFRANYIEYELALEARNKVQVVDWTDYWWGHRFSDHMGLSMIQSSPNVNAARKLVDYSNIRESEVFQVMEVLKATRDRNIPRYFEIVDTLSDQLRRQQVVLKLGLDATRQARNRRGQRAVLESIDQYRPKEVLFALPLLDLYFPSREFEKAKGALVRVRDKLRVDDGLTNARLSAAELVLEDVAQANAYADKAIASEPGLELGWWSAFGARVAAGDYAAATEALSTLKGEFGHELNAETLGKDAAMGDFLASGEFRQWQQDNGGG